MKRHVYKTRRLVLRPLKNSDYKVWFDAYANCLPQKNKWDHGPIHPRRCTKKWFIKIKNKHEALANNDDYYRYYVFDKKQGAIVGFIDFDVFARSTHQFANFGYQIFNRHWRKGYGKEASLAGLRIGFKYLHLNRLEAAINLDNRNSIKLAKSIGMKREGIKKRYWFENGKWTDHLIYVANPEDIGLKAKTPVFTKK